MKGRALHILFFKVNIQTDFNTKFQQIKTDYS